MRAGNRRHKVRLDHNIPAAPNEYGETIAQWLIVTYAWADISPVSLSGLRGAKEVILAGAETGVDIVNITTTPRRDLTITAVGWRVVYEEQVYDVKAVRVNNAADEMVLVCTVGAGV